MLPADSRVVLSCALERWAISVATVVSPALRLIWGGGTLSTKTPIILDSRYHMGRLLKHRAARACWTAARRWPLGGRDSFGGAL